MKPFNRASSLLATLFGAQRASAQQSPSSPSSPSGNSSFNPLNSIQQIIPASCTDNMTRLAPVISLSHGGGPMPLLGGPGQEPIVKSLTKRVPKMLKLGTPEAPRAIVLITAHWSTKKVTISSGAKHDLLYDYYGFPPEAYTIKHDAPGSPEVADLVAKAFEEAGIEYQKDPNRPWDHGVFVPMKLIDPSASIPIVQLSVLSSESPAQSYAIGRALGTLRSQNIAIVGSGFATFHNLRLFGELTNPVLQAQNIEWSDMVTDAAMTDDDAKREEKFLQFRFWPYTYTMHPRGGAEHFLPLIVCAGAAGTTKGRRYADSSFGMDMWSYYWEDK